MTAQNTLKLGKNLYVPFFKALFLWLTEGKRRSLSIKILWTISICTEFSAILGKSVNIFVQLCLAVLIEWSQQIFGWGSSRYWLLSIILYVIKDSFGVSIEKRPFEGMLHIFEKRKSEKKFSYMYLDKFQAL